MIVQDVLNWMETIAPFQSCEDFDNVGLLVGKADSEIRGVVFCLDVTEETVDLAVQKGANLIITHHPIIFHPLKRLDLSLPQGRILQKLLQHQIHVIAAHTNLDKAPGGISDTLADAIGLIRVQKTDEYLRIGELAQAMTIESFAKLVTNCLDMPVRVLYSQSKALRRIAVAGGAYGEGYETAVQNGADAFVTGEIKHHEIIDASARGLVVIDASHYATEWIGVKALYQRFLRESQGKLPAVLEEHRPYRVMTVP